ncbi:MAG: hypothetical protein IJ064_07240 [Bacteroidaceae bacterium]|nr:hypothetical protein [Bacteroidaceae bacterium]
MKRYIKPAAYLTEICPVQMLATSYNGVETGGTVKDEFLDEDDTFAKTNKDWDIWGDSNNADEDVW